ncbi:MAG: hypothetical protein V4591_09775, partial [Bdellovibrionota bacterium]
QSENAQSKYLIRFTNYEENNYKEHVLKKNVAATKKETDKEVVVSVPQAKNKDREYTIATGIGYNYFTGDSKNANITNIGKHYGSIVYSTTSLQYKSFFVGIDVAPIHRNVVLYQDVTTRNDDGTKTTTTLASNQSQNGYFVRPNLGIKKLFYTPNP